MVCRCFCCLFEKDGLCTLKSSSINEAGRCKEALILKPEREYMKKLKEKKLHPEIIKIEMP